MPTSKKLLKPNLSLPIDVRRLIDGTDNPAIKALGAYLEDMGEQLSAAIDNLAKSSGDVSKMYFNNKNLVEYVTETRESIDTSLYAQTKPLLATTFWDISVDTAVPKTGSFIPVTTYGKYKANYIYARKSDGTTEEIERDTGTIVYDIDSACFYRWDGTAWEVKLDYSKQMTPVTFIGGFTDEYATTDGLTGPFIYGATTGEAIATDGDILTLTATGAYAYCGRTGGAFIPAMDVWAIEAKITGLDITGSPIASETGIFAVAGDIVDNIPVYNAGCPSMYFSRTLAPPFANTYRIYCLFASDGYVNVAQGPTVGVPLYLRMEHSYSSPNHTVVFKYKWEGDGSWTTLDTQTYSEATLAWTGKFIDCGPYIRSQTGVSRTANHDYLTVEYTPTSVPGDPYAFIPTVDFMTYVTNYIYIKGDDDIYVSHTPQEGGVIQCADDDQFYKYTAAGGWEIYVPEHHLTHENGGDDEISVTGLSGLLADAQTPLQHALQSTTYHSSTGTSGKMVKFTTDGMVADATNTDAEVAAAVSASHARQHALNSTSDHTMTAVENNFLSADASGLPKDSGKSDASYEDAGTVATHAALTGDVHGVVAPDTIASTGDIATAVADYLPLAGGTMTGDIIMAEDKYIGMYNAAIHFNGGSSIVEVATNIRVGDSIPVTIVGKGMICGNTSGNWTAYFGQSNTRNAGFGWVYNATAASAYGRIFTFGYTNPFQLDASVLQLQTNSAGTITIGGNATFTTTKALYFRDSAIYTCSLDDGHYDVTADVSVDLNTPLVNVGGAVLFTGSGLGLAHGEIYAEDVADTITIAGSGVANKVQITSFAVDGLSNNMTPDHTNDHITVTKAGRYLVNVSIAIRSAALGGADTFGFAVYKNNGATQFPNCHAHRQLAGGGVDTGSVSISGIIQLAVNDTIEVWCWNEDSTDDLVVDDINLSLVQIAGTSA